MDNTREKKEFTIFNRMKIDIIKVIVKSLFNKVSS